MNGERDVRRARRSWSRVVDALLVFALAAAVLAGASPSDERPVALIADLTRPGRIDVRLTSVGPIPADIVAEPGQTIVWHNEAAAARSVADDSGLLSSGQIPSGGLFAASLPAAGQLSWYVDGTPAGTITVGETALFGDASAPIEDALDGGGFPPLEPDDIVLHPSALLEARRDAILLTFVPGTTVGEANDVLDRYGLTVLGSLLPEGIVLVGVADPDDFSVIGPLIDSLSSEPAVEAAALDLVLREEALPEREGQRLIDELGWTWEPEPVEGVGLNWHLESARAPQAWNLREAAVDGGRGVDAAIVDTSFDFAHPELAPVLTERTYCVDGGSFLGSSFCNENDPTEAGHGTHVASIVGSSWDLVPRNGLEGTRGIGANTGDLVGVPWAGNLNDLQLVHEVVEEKASGGLRRRCHQSQRRHGPRAGRSGGHRPGRRLGRHPRVGVRLRPRQRRRPPPRFEPALHPRQRGRATRAGRRVRCRGPADRRTGSPERGPHRHLRRERESEVLLVRRDALAGAARQLGSGRLHADRARRPDEQRLHLRRP